MLEKYMNMKGFLEKSFKINSALKSTGETRGRSRISGKWVHMYKGVCVCGGGWLC